MATKPNWFDKFKKAAPAPAAKKGSKVKKCAKGGGIEIRGKTRGKII
jgi:hypothetical protein